MPQPTASKPPSVSVLEAGTAGPPDADPRLTANTLVEDRYACFEAGMDGFLIKPLDREKLADALQAWPPRDISLPEDRARDGIRARYP